MASYGRLITPEREFTQVPVTALAFYEPPSGDNELSVLAAEDTDLAIYSVTSGRLISRQRAVLANQPIHGIHAQPRGSTLLVWGSDSVVLLSTAGVRSDASPAQLEVLSRKRAPDWIYDGVVSPTDPSSAVLVTGHNEVVRLKYDETQPDGAVLAEAVSPSRTMLFSARLRWEDSDQVLVAAGTAFGEILVWRYRFEGGRAEHEMLYTFTGHEGSIFDVDLSPLLSLPDGHTARLLASCSDDRTVRVWDIGERDGDPALERPGVHSDEPRDTGFSVKTGKEARPRGMVAVNMGHLSRIWGVRFAAEDNRLGEDGPNVYSFGEDTTVQEWRLNNVLLEAGSLTGELSPGRLLSPHDGKHIWSKALTHSHGRRFIATGGADGKVSLIGGSLAKSTVATDSRAISTPHGHVTTMIIPDILGSLAYPSTLRSKKEIIDRYVFVREDELLATTTGGRVLLGTFTEEAVTWQEIDVPDEIYGDIKNCYVMTAVGNGAAILGTTSSNIYFYGNGSISSATKLPRKVVEIFRLTSADDDGSANQGAEVLVFTHGSSIGHLLTFNHDGTLQSRDEITTLDSRFVAISAAKIRDLLFIGSRHGYLSVLRQEGSKYQALLDMATTTRDAIGCIVPLPSKSHSASAPLYVLAASRDGMYRIYEVEDQGSSLRLHLRSETSPPVGSLIVRAWFTTDPIPELILCSFRGTRFIVWNETRREELASIECGGGPHRNFSLYTGTASPDRLKFSFTRLSTLSVYQQDAASVSSLKQGTHGREIRALSYNGRYLATGSEDTTIRIWDSVQGSNDGEPEMLCVAYIKYHVTGLQRLQWLGDDYLFSSAGNEEFFVWHIRKLDAYYGLAILCEGVFPQSVDGDLRIVDFAVSRSPNADGSVIVTLAFSNSALKTYRYKSDSGFDLLAEAKYTGACLTQTRHIHVGPEELTVLTAATDGHLALWRAELSEAGAQRYELQQVASLHQSSIKSLEMIQLGSDYRIVTGGDDNALGSAWLRQVPGDGDETRRRFTISGRGIVRRAHAAAVNGVVLRKQGDGEVAAVSVSNDQKVKIWSVGSSRVELLRDVYSGVADPGDVCLVDGGRRVVVAGVGVELWRLWE